MGLALPTPNPALEEGGALRVPLPLGQVLAVGELKGLGEGELTCVFVPLTHNVEDGESVGDMEKVEIELGKEFSVAVVTLELVADCQGELEGERV